MVEEGEVEFSCACWTGCFQNSTPCSGRKQAPLSIPSWHDFMRNVWGLKRCVHVLATFVTVGNYLVPHL